MRDDTLLRSGDLGLTISWPTDHISPIEMIEGATIPGTFSEEYEQSPPIYSAVKQDGVRLYEKAREKANL